MIQLFHDRERKVLIYETDRAQEIARYVPQAMPLPINGRYVAVPINLYNFQILRQLQLPIVPIMDGYDWPIEPGRKPLSHQILNANFKVTHPRCFDLSDMGTMKTLATLWAADWLMLQYPKGTFRALVVAPLSILSSVWGSAIYKNFIGRRTFQIVHGSAEQRLRALAKPADFYIINHDGVGVGARTQNVNHKPRVALDGFSKELAERTDIQLAIVDEASAYRDSTTRRHRLARMVFGGKNYLWQLTGTPTPNGPDDAYGLAKLSNDVFGESYGSFKKRVMVQISTFKWVPQRGANEEVRKILSPSIRFDIRDVWDGPLMTTQEREVSLTGEQQKLLRDLKREFQVLVSSGQKITATNEAGARLKAIQISLGAIYDKDHESHTVNAQPRIEELRTVLREAPGKSLIFVPLTNVVNLLYKELTWQRDAKGNLKRTDISAAVVNGNTPAKDRAAIFRGFQEAEEPRILIADPACMAHGLDLWQARTVIWYGPCDRTELYLQANKRAHRPGQKHPVTIVQLVSNKLEREIFRRLAANENLQGAFLQMVREGLND